MIAEKMRLFGYNHLTDPMCHDKWRGLIRTYKKVKDKKKSQVVRQLHILLISTNLMKSSIHVQKLIQSLRMIVAIQDLLTEVSIYIIINYHSEYIV